MQTDPSSVAWRLFVWIACFSLADHLISAEPLMVTTEHGRYAIHVLEKPDATELELSDDDKYVLLQSGDRLSCCAYTDLNTNLGQISLQIPGNWKVVGSQLIVGEDKVWKFYSIPSLEPVKEVPLPPNLDGQNSSPPKPIHDGWLANGLIYSPDTSRVIGTKRGWIRGKWIDLSKNFEVERTGHSTLTNPSNTPMQIPGVSDHIECSAEGFRIVGFDLIPFPMLTEQPKPWGRSGPGWMSLQVKRSQVNRSLPNAEYCHVVVKVLSINRENCPSPIGHFSLTQPAILLDSNTQWQHRFVGSTAEADTRIVTFPSLSSNGITIPDEFNLELQSLSSDHDRVRDLHWLFPKWQYLHGSSNPVRTREALEKAISEKYVRVAKAEFELAVGRPTKEIPISIYVAACKGPRKHDYFVWTEVSMAEVLRGFSDESFAAIDRENARLVAEEQRLEIERRNQVNLEIEQANRISLGPLKEQANAKADFRMGILNFSVNLVLGCLSLAAIAALSFLPKRAAAVLLACVVPASLHAQGKWTIEEGREVVKQVTSFSLTGENHDMKVGYLSGIGLVKYDAGPGKSVLMSLNLKTGQRIATAECPGNWSWNSTIVGTKYAACTHGNQLLLLDMATCKMAAQTEIPAVGKIEILFDKALWLAPNQWFALPSLKAVAQHPIVDPGALARWRYGHSAAPFMTSTTRCVINGIEFDNNLRETGNFFGHAFEIHPSRAAGRWQLKLDRISGKSKSSKDSDDAKGGRDRNKDKSSDKEPDTWKISGLLQDESPSYELQVKAPTAGRKLLALAPKRFSSGQRILTLLPFEGGMWTITSKPDVQLIVVQFQDAYQALRQRAYPQISATFATLDTPAPAKILMSNNRPLERFFAAKVAGFNRRMETLNRHSMQVSRAPFLPDDRSTETLLSDYLMCRYELNASSTSPGECMFVCPLGIKPLLEKPSVLGRYLVEQVCFLGGESAAQNWTDVLTKYRAHCTHWLKFAPETLRSNDALVPIELPLVPAGDQGFRSAKYIGWASESEEHVTYSGDVYCSSVIMFLPEDQLRAQFDAARKTNSGLTLPIVAADELPKNIGQFDARSRNFTLPPVVPPKPLPEFVQAKRLDPDSIAGEIDVTIYLKLFLLPVAVLLRAIILWIAVASNNRTIERERDKLHFPGKFVGILLVALAWTTLESAGSFAFGFVAGFVMGINVVTYITVFFLSLMISLTLIYFLLFLATQRSIDELNKVALGSFIVVALASLRALRFFAG